MQGRTLGHFLVLGPLGSGGMGDVYLARDLNLRREVAVKVVRAGSIDDPTARDRLLREARTASSLNHPNICTIFEVGETDGDVWIAMERIDGRPLSRAIGGGLPAEEAVQFGIEIADALAHAHERRVIHRDLKSANLMVTNDGRIKVLDFGLARRLATTPDESRASLTETGMLVGTPHYMAPEVLLGGEADERSDVWALGVVLYEMLAGRLPFRGPSSMGAGASILHDTPEPLPAGVPAGLRTIVSRCLEKDRDRRFARAREVRSALEAVRAGGSSTVVEGKTRPMRRQATRTGGRAGSRWPFVGAVAIGVPVLLAALWILDPAGWRRGGGAQAIDALAVLPLENMSHNADQEYFADGMTDELITSLGKISALRVIARSSVMAYKGTHEPLRDIARRLNVAAVLEGSVLESHDQVRITAQLIQASTGSLLWSESYERKLSDVITLQSEVALAIAQQIQVKLTPAERAGLGRAAPVNPAAHEAYLRGRFEWNRSTRQEKERGVAYFKHAIEIDPGYALAYAGLADAYYSVSNFWMPPDQAMPLAKAAARRALEIDPGLADAHALVGIVTAEYDRNFPEAEAEFVHATELNPNSSVAHLWFGYYLTQMGRFNEARRELGSARDLDPLASYLRWIATWPSYYEGKYDEAMASLREVVGLDPGYADSYALMGECYEQKHDYQRALVELHHAEKLGTHAWTIAAIGRVYAEAGKRDSALIMVKRLANLSQSEYVTPYGVATIYAGLGENDQAFSWLERGLHEHSEDILFLRVDPRIARLRGDPRFEPLAQRIGFPSAPSPPPSRS